MTIQYLATCLLLPFVAAVVKPYRFTMPKMGSPFIITIYSDDSLKAEMAATAAFKQVDTLNMIFSDYTDSSELSALNRSSGSKKYMPVSPHLYNILQQSLNAARTSKGSFDITIGPAVKLWRKARKTHTFPDSMQLREALQHCGYRYIHINRKLHGVQLQQPGMQLDLGGIAKGYAAQHVVNYLKAQGFPYTMADAGGDLATGDAPPGKQGWHIGINEPEQTEELLPGLVQLHNKAIATSGDVYQYVLHNGIKYSHIINPATGMGVTFQRNVTVIANDGATADWLATACSILPIPQAQQLIAGMPGSALLITELKDGHMIRFSSPNFKNYEAK
ncbi:FAD:protein FMN transferase [Deminuibacter soli]|uniref:FAD:protein FMN transferase n=1 Tax=Deminuibacter soli TaxID=2291815 RepID=A0A3E1NJT0_9BACT|nr:FAD:protein FMN transferase [Deminuibacter soli]RFM28195.1 FAD:protein FMN transferase [Deminuibacter soli]